MPTRTDKMLLYIESQIKEADSELSKIPSTSPAYLVMRCLIRSQRDLVTILREFTTPENPDLAKARTLAAELDFSDTIPPGSAVRLREIAEDEFDKDARERG